MLRSPILWAALLVSNAPPPTPADYTVCQTVSPGPIIPHDGYQAHPYDRRKADLA